jgi:uncharacterized protein
MPTGLITGASSGIGAEFARELAARKLNLVLVARSGDRLYQLAETLQTQFQIQVDVLVQDLLLPDAGTTIYQATQSKNLKIDLLINNAGFGDYGAFAERPRQKQLDMIQLNIMALVDLTHQFLPGMVAQRSGGIINVASIAAFQPLPYLSVYAATKAFVLSFSEALWAETQNSGVKVLALCPGPTESNFFQVAEFPTSFNGKTQGLVPASQVVKEALRALESHQPNVVTGGIGNQIVINASRFLPRPTLVSWVEKQFGRGLKG